MDCYACQRPDTKYRCIKCAKRICNICSVPSENEPGYSEKEYMVGICSCIEYKSIDENKEECKNHLKRNGNRRYWHFSLIRTLR